MGLFEHFPYTNFHELNADWMLRKIKNLEQRMTAAEARLDAAEARLDSAEDRLDAIEAELVVINNEITLIKNRCTALEARCTELESRCTALEARCTDLEARVTALEARMSTAEDTLEDHGDRIEDLENRVEVKYYETGITDPDVLVDIMDKAVNGIIYPVFYDPLGTGTIKKFDLYHVRQIYYAGPGNVRTNKITLYSAGAAATSYAASVIVGYLVEYDNSTSLFTWEPITRGDVNP